MRERARDDASTELYPGELIVFCNMACGSMVNVQSRI